MHITLNHQSVLEILRTGPESAMTARCALRADLLADLKHQHKLTLLHVLDLLDYMHIAGHHFKMEWSLAVGSHTPVPWTDRDLDWEVVGEAQRLDRSVLYVRVKHAPAGTHNT